MSQMIPKNMSPRYYILSSTTINCRSLPLKLFCFCNDFPKLRSFSYRKIEKYTIEYKTFPYSTIGVSTPQNGPFRFNRFDCYWIQTYKQIESPNLDNMRKVYNVNINITCFFPVILPKYLYKPLQILFIVKYYTIDSWYIQLNLKELSLCPNSDFLIPISLQSNVVDLRYFKLWILLDQII